MTTRMKIKLFKYTDSQKQKYYFGLLILCVPPLFSYVHELSECSYVAQLMLLQLFLFVWRAIQCFNVVIIKGEVDSYLTHFSTLLRRLN